MGHHSNEPHMVNLRGSVSDVSRGQSGIAAAASADKPGGRFSVRAWAGLGLLLLTVLCGAGAQARNDRAAALEATIDGQVRQLGVQARSSQNGWRLVTTWFPARGAQRDSAVDRVLREGDRIHSLLAESPSKVLPAELRTFVSSFAPLHATLQKAVGSRYFLTSMDLGNGMDVPYDIPLKRVARCLAVEGRVRLGDGQVDRAVDCWLLSQRLGARLAGTNRLIPGMISVGVAATTQDEYLLHFRRTVDKRPASTRASALRRLAMQLYREPAFGPGFVSTMDHEYLVSLRIIEKSFRQKAPPTGAAEDSPVAGASDVRLYREWYADARGLFQGPPSAKARRLMLERRNTWMKRFDQEKAAICTLTVPDWSHAWYRFLMADARLRALTLLNALFAHHAERGYFPVRLADLVPTYLPAVPRDPLNAASAFGYRRTEKDFVLYSLGPDARDDGGKGVPFTKAHSESKGDIVFFPLGSMAAPERKPAR